MNFPKLLCTQPVGACSNHTPVDNTQPTSIAQQARQALEQLEQQHPDFLGMLSADPASAKTMGQTSRLNALENFKNSPAGRDFQDRMTQAIQTLQTHSGEAAATDSVYVSLLNKLAISPSFSIQESEFQAVLFEMYVSTCLDLQKLAALVDLAHQQKQALHANVLPSIKQILRELSAEIRVCPPGVMTYVESALGRVRHMLVQPTNAEQLRDLRLQVAEQYLIKFVDTHMKNEPNFDGNHVHMVAALNNHLAQEFDLPIRNDILAGTFYIRNVATHDMLRLRNHLHHLLDRHTIAQELATDLLNELKTELLKDKVTQETLHQQINSLVSTASSRLCNLPIHCLVQTDEHDMPIGVAKQTTLLALELLHNVPVLPGLPSSQSRYFSMRLICPANPANPADEPNQQNLVELHHHAPFVWKTTQYGQLQQKEALQLSDLSVDFLRAIHTQYQQSQQSRTKNSTQATQIKNLVQDLAVQVIAAQDIPPNSALRIHYTSPIYSIPCRNLALRALLYQKIKGIDSHPELLDLLMNTHSIVGLLRNYYQSRYLDQGEVENALRSIANCCNWPGNSNDLLDEKIRFSDVQSRFIEHHMPNPVFEAFLNITPKNQLKALWPFLLESMHEPDNMNSLLSKLELQELPQNILAEHIHEINTPELVNGLIEKGINPNARGQQGQTALHTLSKYSTKTTELPYLNFACLLLNAGANLNQVDWFGETPLHWAAKHGAHNMLELFIEYFDSMELLASLKNSSGQTALDLALEEAPEDTEIENKTKLKCAGLLIKANHNPDQFDPQGYAPIHRAVLNNNVRMVMALFYAGANLSIPAHQGPHKGLTPFQLAWNSRRYQIAGIIADLSIEENATTTPSS